MTESAKVGVKAESGEAVVTDGKGGKIIEEVERPVGGAVTVVQKAVKVPAREAAAAKPVAKPVKKPVKKPAVEPVKTPVAAKTGERQAAVVESKATGTKAVVDDWSFSKVVGELDKLSFAPYPNILSVKGGSWRGRMSQLAGVSAGHVTTGRRASDSTLVASMVYGSMGDIGDARPSKQRVEVAEARRGEDKRRQQQLRAKLADSRLKEGVKGVSPGVPLLESKPIWNW